MLCARCKKVPTEPGLKRCRKCLDYVAKTVRAAQEARRLGITRKPGRPKKYSTIPSPPLPLDGC